MATAPFPPGCPIEPLGIDRTGCCVYRDGPHYRHLAPDRHSQNSLIAIFGTHGIDWLVDNFPRWLGFEIVSFDQPAAAQALISECARKGLYPQNQSTGEPAGSLPPTAETAGAGLGPEAEDKAFAIAAAHCAATATEELLRFARHGPLSDHFAFTDDTIEQLADSLKLAIEIELPRRRAAADDAEGVELLGQLISALTRFLEGWA